MDRSSDPISGSAARPPQPPPRHLSMCSTSPNRTPPSKFYISSSMDTSYAVTPDTTATGPALVEQETRGVTVTHARGKTSDDEQSFTQTATFSGHGSSMTSNSIKHPTGPGEKLRTRSSARTAKLVEALQSTSFTSSSSQSSSRIPLVSSVAKASTKDTSVTNTQSSTSRVRGHRVTFRRDGDDVSGSTSGGPLGCSYSIDSSSASALLGASEVNGDEDGDVTAAVLHSFLQSRATSAPLDTKVNGEGLPVGKDERSGKKLDEDGQDGMDIDAEMATKLLYVLQKKDEVIRDLTHSLLESHAEGDRFQETVHLLQDELKKASSADSNSKDAEKCDEELTKNIGGGGQRKVSDAILIDRLRQENQGYVERLTSQERQLERLQLRVNQLQLEGQHREEVINTLQQEMNDALLKWEAVVRELREAEHTMVNQKLQIEQLEKERQDKKAFWERERESWKAEEKRLRSALQVSESRHQAEWSALQTEITQLSEDVNEVNATRQEQLRHSKTLEDQLMEKSSQCSALEQQLADIQQRRVHEASLFEEARLLDKQEKLKMQATLEQKEREHDQIWFQNQQLHQAQSALDQEIKRLTETLEVSTQTIHRLQQQLCIKEKEQEQLKNTALERFETLLREEEEQQKSVLSQVEFCVQNGEEMNRIVAAAEYKRKKAEDKLQKVIDWNERLQISAQEQAAKMSEDMLEQHQWAADALGKLHGQLQEATARLHEAIAQNADLNATVRLQNEILEKQKNEHAHLETSILRSKEELKEALFENLSLSEERERWEKAVVELKRKEDVTVRQLERWQSILWNVVRILPSAGVHSNYKTASRQEYPSGGRNASLPAVEKNSATGDHSANDEWSDETDCETSLALSSHDGKHNDHQDKASTRKNGGGCTVCPTRRLSSSSSPHLQTTTRLKHPRISSAADLPSLTTANAELSVGSQGRNPSKRARQVLKRISILVYQLHENVPPLKKTVESLQVKVQELKAQRKRALQISQQRQEKQNNETSKLRKELDILQEKIKHYERQERKDISVSDHFAAKEVEQRIFYTQLLLHLLVQIPDYLVSILEEIIKTTQKLAPAPLLPSVGLKKVDTELPRGSFNMTSGDATIPSGFISPEWSASALITQECDDLVKGILGLEGGWHALTAAASAQSSSSLSLKGPIEAESQTMRHEREGFSEVPIPISYLSTQLIPAIAKFKLSEQQQNEMSMFIQAATLRMEKQYKKCAEQETTPQKTKNPSHRPDEVATAPLSIPSFLSPLLDHQSVGQSYCGAIEKEGSRVHVEPHEHVWNKVVLPRSTEITFLFLRCVLHVITCCAKDAFMSS